MAIIVSQELRSRAKGPELCDRKVIGSLISSGIWENLIRLRYCGLVVAEGALREASGRSAEVETEIWTTR